MTNFLSIFNSNLYWGNTLQSWIIAACYILGAVVINRIIVYINKNYIRKITAKTSSNIDDILFRLLEAPVLFGVILFSIYLASESLILDEAVTNVINKSFKILIAINVTWFVARLSKALIEEIMKPKEGEVVHGRQIDHHVIVLTQKAAGIIIWLIGIVVALNNSGYNVSALIGTLGIGGLAFALAAQDTLKNVFGGLTILTDKPFKLGDRILVDGYDGMVEDIGVRSTRIRTLERKLVIIPNSKLSDASIENVNEEPMRRMLVKLGLTYDTTPENMDLAIEILKNLHTEINLISDECYVWFSDYGDFSLIISYIYFIKKESDIPETISTVNRAILKKFNAAGLNFAFPTQTIQMQK